ncbi:hypothetical protein U3A55_12990 [Salarchaeum sp. III]|uniref:LVIVD repeat-containing protein n=1 Tax=Salarchaeum sp. III TaxID=3107927 RepID=UPI002ED81317
MEFSRRAALRAGAAALALPLAGRASAHPEPYEPRDSVAIEGATEAVVGPDGTTIFVAATTGFAVVDASDPTDLTVLAERRGLLADREDGPLTGIHDVKVHGTRLAVVGPANSGRPSALLLYDVRDPANPVREAVHETDYPIHNCFLTDSHAYLTANHSDRRELAIVDVSGTPREVARWGAADENPAWLDVPGFLWSCHDVYVQDGVAYVAHWDAGTWLLDVSDPASPAVISHIAPYDPADLADAPTSRGYELPGNHHYAAPNDDASVLAVNSEAWETTPEDDRTGGPGGITLYDITDPANPRELSHIPAPETANPGLGGTWTTSHNFELAGDRLYTSWYQGGVKLFDVRDPAEPFELAWWRQPAEAAFWTARAAADCFVASSYAGVPAGTRGALYAFPDHAGYQPDAPSLTATTTTANATTTTATATRTPTTTESPSSGSTPGFGVLAALLGAAGAAGVARWLRDEPNS